MKNLFVLLFIILFTSLPTNAIGIDNSKYFDNGLVYSGSSYPQDVAKDVNNIEKINSKNLKRGESKSRNYFGLVEVGDASIITATKNGNIKRVHYVDNKINKVYIPYILLPIYVKEKTTIVYGE